MPVIEGFKPLFAPGVPENTDGDFVRGLKQGALELKGTGYGLLGAAGKVVENATGYTGLKDYGLENAEEAFRRSEAKGKPTDQIEGINGIGDAIDYAQRGVGYLLPNVLASIGGGGVGGIVARGAGRAAIEAGGAQVARDLTRRGAIAGLGLTSYGQELGSIYPDMVREGHDDLGRAALYAAPAAALDVLPEARIAGKFLGEGVDLAGRSLRRRVGGEAIRQGGIEAGTEIGQTAIERAASYKDLGSPEAISEYLNAGALGALGGGTAGGITGALQRGKPTNLLDRGNQVTEQTQGELDLRGGQGMASPLATPYTDLASLRDELRGKIESTTDSLDKADLSRRLEAVDRILARNQPGQGSLNFDGPQQIETDPAKMPQTLAGGIVYDPISKTYRMPTQADPMGRASSSAPAPAVGPVEQVGAGAPNRIVDSQVAPENFNLTSPTPAMIARQFGEAVAEKIRAGQELTDFERQFAERNGLHGYQLEPQGDMRQQSLDLQPRVETPPAPSFPVNPRSKKNQQEMLDFTGSEPKLTTPRAHVAFDMARSLQAEGKMDEADFEQIVALLETHRYGVAEKKLLDARSKPAATPVAPAQPQGEANAASQVIQPASVQVQPQGGTEGGQTTQASTGDSVQRTEESQAAEGQKAALTRKEKNDIRDLNETLEVVESAKKVDQYKAAIDDITFEANENKSEAVRNHAKELLKTLPAKDAEESQARYSAFAEANKATEAKKGSTKTKKNKDVLYRDGQEVKPGMEKATVEKLIERIVAGWKNAPKITVIQSIDELGERIATAMREEGNDNNPAFYDPATKSVVIIADNAIDATDVAMSVAHEATGHFGLRTILGNQYEQVMNRIFAGNASVRARANEKISQGMDKPLAVEEVLAEMQEKGVEPKDQGMFEKLYEIIRAAVKKIFGVEDVSDNEVATLLTNARKYVIEGKGEAGIGEASMKQRMYRGYTTQSVASTAADMGAEIVSNAVGKIRRMAKSMMMLNMFEEEYGDRLTAIKSYRDNSKKQGAEQRAWLEKAGQVENMRRKLSRADDKLLSEVQLDATRSEIHPDLPFTDEKNAHLKDVPGAVQAHARLAAMWRRLTDEAKAVYKAELEFNEKARDEQEAYTNRLLTDVYNKQIEDAKAQGNEALAEKLEAERKAIIAERGEVLKRIRGPYFALTRSGDFVVVGKSTKFVAAEEKVDAADKKVRELMKMEKPDEEALTAARKEAKEARVEVDKLRASDSDYVVEFHASEYRAKQRQKELESMGKSYKMMRNEFSRDASGISPSTISTVRAAVMKDFDPKVASQMADLLERLMLEHLPDASIKKHDLSRVGVAGAEGDMGLAFRQNAFRTAFALARLKHASDINGSLGELRDQAKRTGRDVDDEVYNTILSNHLASMQYKETPLQNAAVSMSYVYHLAWSPAFLLQNVLQNPMLTVPMMSAKFGFAKSMSTWAKAAGEVTKYMKSTLDKGVVHFKLDIDEMTKDAGERKMLNTLLERGLIDITMDNEMDLTGNPVAAKAREAMRWASYPASWMEVVNRSSAALSAFRLARRSGMKEDEAIRYAERVVNDTHIDYSSENAPHWMRAGVVPLGKVFFQFRKFQIGMLYQMVKNFRDAVKGDKEAAKVLMNTLIMQQLVAGAAGFPAAAPIGFIVQLIGSMFSDKDEPFDAEVAWRNFLSDLLGEEGGRAVAKGLPTLIDLDLSGSVGLGNIMSLFPYTKEKKSFREQGLEYMLQFFGPSGGLAADTLEGFDLINQGSIEKGVEKLMPRTIRNVMKAGRFADEGVTTRSGNEVKGADNFNALDIFTTAAGVPSAELNDMYLAKSFVENQKTARTDVRNRLIKDMLAARRDNDTDAINEVQSDISAYNERHPDDKITASTILKSRQQNAKYQKDLVNGVRVGKRERELKDELRFSGTP